MEPIEENMEEKFEENIEENIMENNYVVMDKKEIKKCRHKAERRWYRRLLILNLLIVIGIICWFKSETKANRKYVSELQTTFASSVENSSKNNSKSTNKINKKLEELPDSMHLFFFVVALIFVFPILVSYTYAQYRSMSVKITKNNFPEIYEIAREYSARLGMKKVPAIYIIQGNGILNAFSSCIPFKQYIELYADLVEVAYREHHDMETLRFLIAHEISHIYLGHAKLYYNYSILFSSMIPILSSTASRAREYSCDRIAQRLSGSDGIDTMMTLTVGIHLYKKVDKEDYIEHAKTVRGFFVWCFNLVSSHPLTSKRVLALEMKEGTGKLY